MIQLLDMDTLKSLTTSVDSRFTRFNNNLSLSNVGGFRERQFGRAVAFQDQNRPLSEYYNRIVGFGEDEIPLLPEMIRWYDEAGLDFVVSLPPQSQSDAITSSLHAENFRFRSSDFVYCMRLDNIDDDLVEPNIEVQLVTEDLLDNLFDFMASTGVNIDSNMSREVRDRYCSAPFRFYIAVTEGKTVARGSVFFCDGAAWLNNAVTDDGYRGRGCHSALLHARIRAARNHGCSLAVSDTQYGSTSHRNLLRAGFALGFTTVEMKRSHNI